MSRAEECDDRPPFAFLLVPACPDLWISHSLAFLLGLVCPELRISPSLAAIRALIRGLAGPDLWISLSLADLFAPAGPHVRVGVPFAFLLVPACPDLWISDSLCLIGLTAKGGTGSLIRCSLKGFAAEGAYRDRHDCALGMSELDGVVAVEENTVLGKPFLVTKPRP